MGARTLRNVKGSAVNAAENDHNLAELTAQTAHGLSVGELVKVAASGWAKAQADAAANVARGVVLAVPDANTVYVLTNDGQAVTRTGHGLGARGTVAYLSQSTPGAWTATNPGSGIVQPVGVVLDADTILFDRTYPRDI